MLNQLTRLFFPSAERQRAHLIYVALVEQSRNPFFYTTRQVPDTLDGRFELILLHMYLVLHRLKAAHGGQFDAKESGFERELIEVFVEDMDRSLREIGVGDLGVGRRVKVMANAFYGRLQSYETARQADAAVLQDSLARNLYGTTQATPDTLAAMEDYVQTSVTELAAQPLATIQEGRITFLAMGA
ncbi:MAG: hypothetical protein K2Q12_06960 [Rickettsiales bacterium]|nr:hypothetical protein [Rickettsiales bacterium]